MFIGTGTAGVYRSVNGGASWVPANAGMENKSVLSIALQPGASSTVYAAVYSWGVYESTDAGATWTIENSGLGDLHANSLAIDPTAPLTVYVAADGGVFKTTDGAP